MLKKIINWFLGKDEEKEDFLEKLEKVEKKNLKEEFKESDLVELVDSPKKKKTTTHARKKTTRKTSTKKTVKPSTKKKTTKKDEVMKFLGRRKNPVKIEVVAEKVGITVQTARRYLYYLKKEGKVDSKDGGWVKK